MQVFVGLFDDCVIRYFILALLKIKMTKGAKDVASRFSKHVNKMYTTIAQIVFALLFSSLSIAALSIGLLRKNDCPLQPKIPLWLIVYGAVGIAMNTIMIVSVRQLIYLICIELYDIFIFELVYY